MSGLGWFSTAQVQISGFALKVLIQSVKLLRPTTSSLIWLEDVLSSCTQCCGLLHCYKSYLAMKDSFLTVLAEEFVFGLS